MLFSRLCTSIVRSIWSYRLVRIALGLLFLYAGAIKLADMAGFALVIEEYGLVHGNAAHAVAFLLPATECLAGAMLVLDIRGALTTVALMCVLFLAVLGYALAADLTIGDCGCFETGELPEGTEDGSALRIAFIRDIFFLMGCAYCYWWRAKFHQSTPPQPSATATTKASLL